MKLIRYENQACKWRTCKICISESCCSIVFLDGGDGCVLVYYKISGASSNDQAIAES